MANALNYKQMGGGYLTQAFPTNFHVFVPALVLRSGDSASNWREVTASEMATIQAVDAKYVEPSQEFIDEVVKGSYNTVKWNADTGFFELNRLNDISVDEMRVIYAERALVFAPGANITGRTTIPAMTQGNWGTYLAANFRGKFLTNKVIETIRLTTQEYIEMPQDTYYMFAFCPNLRQILTPLRCQGYAPSDTAFDGCAKLEHVMFRNLAFNLTIKDSPLLSLESMQYLVKNASNGTKAIKVKVHADVYAKLTDPDNAEWYKVTTDAQAKNITFATS